MASLLTLLRWLSLLVSLTLPAVFTAISMYHQEMIPTQLLMSMIEAKQKVPCSVAFEILVMLAAFELLMEAGLRLPDPIGDTVSIIGALIVGQSAVEARIVSPISVIVVAAAAIWFAAKSGLQAALMAPTGILAQQHYLTLEGMLSPLGIRVGLLTGSLRAEERRSLLDALQAGKLQVLVGTHAIFAEGVNFANLGLAVVDEQHRFGVLQKNALIAKGRSPHVLVMTATPIPRTLIYTIYGKTSMYAHPF